jgi:hypothetical protein
MTMTSASLLARAQDGVVDEPDPAARPRRRSFTAEYKEQILDQLIERHTPFCQGDVRHLR